MAASADNKALARLFYRMSKILDLKGENQFKAIAFFKVKDVLENMPQDVRALWKAGGKKAVQDVNGIGASSAKIISDWLETGRGDLEIVGAALIYLRDELCSLSEETGDAEACSAGCGMVETIDWNVGRLLDAEDLDRDVLAELLLDVTVWFVACPSCLQGVGNGRLYGVRPTVRSGYSAGARAVA